MLRKSLIIIAWVVAVLVGSMLLSRSTQTRVMKDGRRLHLNNFTFTKNVKIDVRDDNVTLYKQFQALIRGKRISKRYRTVRDEKWGQPRPAVWLEIERKKGEKFRARQLRAEIHMPNGQILGARFGGGSGFVPNRDIYDARLPGLPTTLKELDLRILVDDESFQFNIKNPAYRKSTAPVVLQTLPHTEARGNLVAALDGFIVKPLSKEMRDERGYSVWVVPKFQLWWNGGPADDWFDKEVLFANEAGPFEREGWVFGEPYWKVRITVRQNAKFPRSEEERIQLEPADISLRPGEIRELTVPNTLQRSWQRAVLLGPGSYALTAEGPVHCEMDPATHSSKGSLSPDVVARPIALLLISPEQKATTDVDIVNAFGWSAQDDRNDLVQLTGKRMFKRANRRFSHSELQPGRHSKTVQFNFYEQRTETFEYTVAPPPLPATK